MARGSGQPKRVSTRIRAEVPWIRNSAGAFAGLVYARSQCPPLGLSLQQQFGDVRFEVTDNTAEGLYRAFFNAWVPMMGIFLIPLFWVIPGFYPGSGFLFLFTFIAWVLTPIAFVFTWILYKGFELRTLIGRLRFEGVQFQFDARGGELFWLLFGNLLITLLTLGIAAPVAQRRVAAFVALHLSATGVADLDNIIQSAQEVPGISEGIADALDFGSA